VTNEGHVQGCQMGYFQAKNLNLGQFWRVWRCSVIPFPIILI
jgi:hypothetical protein